MSANRVIVACRLPGALRFGDRPKEVLSRFDRLIEQASVLGGSLVASSYDAAVFAWEEEALHDAVSLATGAAHATHADQDLWACGVAFGEIEAGRSVTASGGRVCWGEAIAAASALARLAKRHEVLVDLSVPAVVSHELLTNRARVGLVGGKRVRGYRVDARQAWRSLAAADVARMVDPPLIGRDAELAKLMEATDVVILRADSGFGGSRMLTEVAAHTKPSRSLLLTPFSVVHEPLGSLRRAMAFVAATERITLPPNLHPVLDQLLGAQGVTRENAALLIAHQVQRKAGAPMPSLLLDDATDIDEPSIEACARAIELLGGGVRVVARIDSMSQLPRSLARFSDGEEVTLGRLDGDAARALAGACTGEALEAGARVQWARRGGGTPLGVVEAVAAGVAKGELLWSSETLERLKRTAGSDIARPVGYWITRRAEGLRESSQSVLVALAHLGGEASAGELLDVVAAVAPEIELQAEIVILRRGRWIRESRPGSFVLATRAHREAILELSRSGHSRDWRAAVAKTLERAPGTLRRAEAAQHAARSGMGEWAARLAMAAARSAAQAGLEESASSLAAFAGAQNPGSADLDLGELPLDDDGDGEDATLVAGGTLSLDANGQVVIEPPIDVDIEVEPEPEPAPEPEPEAEPEPEDESEPVSYQALIDGSHDLRETQWAEIARRSLADGNPRHMHRRGLLALARAYAGEGKSSEALMHGLSALARMREVRDRDGTRTCLLFLARLYEQTERANEAATLKQAAQAG